MNVSPGIIFISPGLNKQGYSVNVPLSKKSREKLCFT